MRDDAVGWPKLLRVREEAPELANLAGEDPLVRAADHWKTLRKFTPALIPTLERSAEEIWFGDEAGIGQMNKITRRWARRGTRPSAPHDPSTTSTYIFGAICPQEGKAAGLVMPWCNTDAMRISSSQFPSRSSQASTRPYSWIRRASIYRTLPSCRYRRNARENVWQYLRGN